MAGQTKDQEYLRATGAQIVAGMLPFVLVGGTVILHSLPVGWWGDRTSLANLSGQIMLYGYLALLVGMVFGIRAGFPRWSYPYMVFGVVFALFLGATSTPGIKLFGIEMWGRQPWGPRAIVPLIVVIILVWRKIDLGRLVDDLVADWTRLSFGLYMLLPLVAWLGMDGMDYTYRFLGLLQAEFIFSLGAFLYMRQDTHMGRVFSLMVCAFLGYLAAAGAAHLFWDTHSVNIETGESSLLPGPIPIMAILVKSAVNAFVATGFVLLPGVPSLWRDQGHKQELKQSAPGEP